VSSSRIVILDTALYVIRSAQGALRKISYSLLSYKRLNSKAFNLQQVAFSFLSLPLTLQPTPLNHALCRCLYPPYLRGHCDCIHGPCWRCRGCRARSARAEPCLWGGASPLVVLVLIQAQRRRNLLCSRSLRHGLRGPLQQQLEVRLSSVVKL
jgi:hypothetical protein